MWDAAEQPALSLESSCCRICQIPFTLKRCAACKNVFYCNTKCQRRDHARHAPECAAQRQELRRAIQHMQFSMSQATQLLGRRLLRWPNSEQVCKALTAFRFLDLDEVQATRLFSLKFLQPHNHNATPFVCHVAHVSWSDEVARILRNDTSVGRLVAAYAHTHSIARTFSHMDTEPGVIGMPSRVWKLSETRFLCGDSRPCVWNVERRTIEHKLKVSDRMYCDVTHAAPVSDHEAIVCWTNTLRSRCSIEHCLTRHRPTRTVVRGLDGR